MWVKEDLLRLPDFLIAGAMKAGTTTLFSDLDTHPEIYFPERKEPACLVDEATLSPGGCARYAAHYRAAAPEQRCGDASTSYTMLPIWPGVPARARRLLGPGLKVIYVVREPVARIISHHRHMLSAGETMADIDRSVRSDPRLLAFSRYAAQIGPWMDTLGPDAVQVVQFERFVRQRAATTAELTAFIGLDPRPELVNASVVRNKSDELRVATGAWYGVQRSRLYQSTLRGLLPAGLRRSLIQAVLPHAPARPRRPSASTVGYILDSLQGEVERLQRLIGAVAPLWDLAEVEREHTTL